MREDAPRAAHSRKSRKKSYELVDAVPAETTVPEPKRRRSTRNSGDKTIVEPPPLEVKKRRPKEKPAPKPAVSKENETDTAQVDQEPQDTVDIVGGTSQVQVEPIDGSRDVTKIALPFADTPIIRRNKEMRKGGGDGSRRSSLGMRGRRASSLIDSGKSNGKILPR